MILSYDIDITVYQLNPLPREAVVFTCLQDKSFENTVGKGEIARNEQFLLFPQWFSTLLENLLPFSFNLELSFANSFSLEKSKSVLWERVNLISSEFFQTY